MTKPVVSILCATYNHENYISKALDSFLSQKTRYSFEIIVRDDASTDSTQLIVLKYANKYPSKIKYYFEEENQYSKSNGISSFSRMLTISSGKYIALCEGDDFWLDSSKLEKQITYMEANSECSFCFTNALLFDNELQAFTHAMLPNSAFEKKCLTASKTINTEEIMKLCFIPTASFVFKRRDYEARPQFSKKAFTGDRYLQMVLTEMGYAYYLDEITVAYRTNNKKSMMGAWAANRQLSARIQWKYANLYKEFNLYTNHKYASTVDYLQTEREYSALFLMLDSDKLKQNKYKAWAKLQSSKFKFKYLLAVHFPWVIKTVWKIKDVFS